MSSPTSSNLSGWAIRRNGSCSYGETTCGPTTDPMYACCPEGSFCPKNTGGPLPNYCCNTATNCSQTILNTGPYCAESDWTLYGEFCCASGSQGYSFDSGGVWCVDSGYDLGDTDDGTTLNIVNQRTKPSPSTASHLPTTSPSTENNKSSGSNHNHDTNNGTPPGRIAGAALGGIVGALLLLLAVIFGFRMYRSRKRRTAAEQIQHENEVENYDHVDEKRELPELDPQAQRFEMDNGQVKGAELEGDKVLPVELPASKNDQV